MYTIRVWYDTEDSENRKKCDVEYWVGTEANALDLIKNGDKTMCTKLFGPDGKEVKDLFERLMARFSV